MDSALRVLMRVLLASQAQLEGSAAALPQLQTHPGAGLLTLPDGAQVRCAVDGTGIKPGEALTLGVRPEHLVVGAAENVLTARVNFVESLGGTTYAYADFPGMKDDEALTVELDGALRPSAGDVLALSVPAARCHLFDSQGRALRRLAAPGISPAPAHAAPAQAA